MGTAVYDLKIIIGTCGCICEGGGVCAYSEIEVNGNLSDAFCFNLGSFFTMAFMK